MTWKCHPPMRQAMTALAKEYRWNYTCTEIQSDLQPTFQCVRRRRSSRSLEAALMVVRIFRVVDLSMIWFCDSRRMCMTPAASNDVRFKSRTSHATETPRNVQAETFTDFHAILAARLFLGTAAELFCTAALSSMTACSGVRIRRDARKAAASEGGGMVGVPDAVRGSGAGSPLSSRLSTSLMNASTWNHIRKPLLKCR